MEYKAVYHVGMDVPVLVSNFSFPAVLELGGGCVGLGGTRLFG